MQSNKVSKVKVAYAYTRHSEGWNGLVIKINKLENKKNTMQLLLALFTEILNKNYKLTD